MKISAGIALAMKQMAERGWRAELCLVRPDGTAGPEVARTLTAQAYDCVAAELDLPHDALRELNGIDEANPQ